MADGGGGGAAAAAGGAAAAAAGAAGLNVLRKSAREKKSAQFHNIDEACKEANLWFEPFLPNGIPNPHLNYKLEINRCEGLYPLKYDTICITIKSNMRPPENNEIMSITIRQTRTDAGQSEGYISALQVGNWVTGEKPEFLAKKRIGHFLMLIYLYISRRLGTWMVELDDDAQIPGYYEFMGFLSYKHEFLPEEKTRYYHTDIEWRETVTKVFKKLYEKNTPDTKVWNWLDDDKTKASIEKMKQITPIHQSISHGMGGGRKRRRSKRKTKRRGTKKYRRKLRSRRKKTVRRKRGGWGERSLKAYERQAKRVNSERVKRQKELDKKREKIEKDEKERRKREEKERRERIEKERIDRDTDRDIENIIKRDRRESNPQRVLEIGPDDEYPW